MTTEIFLREMRGHWHKAAPPLAQLALQAAQVLGLLAKKSDDDRQLALHKLQHLWQKSGMPALSFHAFEAALVRYGLRLRHQKNKLRPLK